jgi:iron(III) transport system permease protein
VTARRVLYLLSAAAAAAALLPVAVLLPLGIGAELALDARSLEILLNTVLLTVLTVVGAVLLGVPLALATACADLPLRRFWLGALTAPLAVPSYLGAFAWFAALGPGGEIEQLLGLATPRARGLAGATLVMTLYTFPFVLLTTRAALVSLDASVVDAARTLGLSLRGALLRVVLPRARKGIAAGALLVALYTLSDFGTPAIMRFDTFTRIIYVEYNAFGLDRAALLSLQLLVLVLAVLALEAGLRSEREPPGRVLALRLSPRQKALALSAAAAVVGATLLLPVAVFGLWLLRDGVVGFSWHYVLSSAYPSLLAALTTALVALPVAFAARSGRLGRLLERVTYIGFGIPGIVMGTALVYVGLRLEPLYQTLALLVMAYVLRFLPLAVGSTRASVERLTGDLTGAARSLGAGPLEAFARVSLPLVRPGLVAGAALVFLEAMRELPATLLLRPTDFETLASYLWLVYEAGQFGRAAVPGLLLMLVSGVAVVVMLSAEARADARTAV